MCVFIKNLFWFFLIIIIFVPKESLTASTIETQTKQTTMVDSNFDNTKNPLLDINIVWEKVKLPKSTLARMKRPKHFDWMNVPKHFEPDLKFWIDVFGKYRDHEVVLHDPFDLSRIYCVIDLSKDYYRTDLPDEERRQILSDLIDETRDKYASYLRELAYNPAYASKTALKLQKLFPKNTSPEDFMKASKIIRAQWGQKDKLLEGLTNSGKYLGQMETIFAKANVPPVITRLVFVESTFVHNAESASGAVGIWQFMPGTGKLYLRMDKAIDERYDELKATTASATLLRHNYDELGSWPLAINAYNAGLGRMKQAKKHLNTMDLCKIMREFSHPSYGFAARNFFVEFVAVASVVDNYPKYFDKINFEKPADYLKVSFPKPLLMKKTIDDSGIPEKFIVQIKELNRGLKKSVWEGRYAMPANYPIKIPETVSGDFITTAVNSYREIPKHHTVMNGEDFEEISAIYGLTTSEVKNLNRQNCKRGKCKVSNGMTIKLQGQ